MFCTKCGSELPDGVKFCTKCGSAVKVKPAVVDETLIKAETVEETSEKDAEKETENETQKKKSGSKATIIIMIIVAIVIALLTGFFVASKLYKDGKLDWKIMESIYGSVDDDDSEEDEEDKDNDEDKNTDVDDADADNENAESDESNSHETSEAFKGVKLKDWCEEYSSYIQNLSDNYTYNLIDVNGDRVYELVCEGYDEATGCLILTCTKDGISELQTARLYFSYIEGENLLNNSDGHMGYYYDFIYRIGEDGAWECVTSGEYYVQDNSNMMYDEFGNIMYLEYEWEGTKTNRGDYFKRLNEAYPDESACVLSKTNSREDMLQILGEYKPILGETRPVHRPEDGQIHEYEFIVSDVSWYEAYEDCARRGGYLVNINSKEEYEHIIGLINSKNLQDKIFFLGARKDYITGEYNWEPGYDIDGNIYYATRNDGIDTNPSYKEYWLKGEPSYVDVSGDYPIEEDVVDMFFNKAENKFVWNDVPQNILDVVPYYSGKIAYIVEYDK